MREVAATGDLTRKIALRHGNRWDDEDAQAAGDDVQHADRLDRAVPARDVAEGAPVVARPAVDGDRARGPQPADDHQGVAPHAAPARTRRESALREAVADIDDEVARLNRIVNEVLDFARPIRFELAPADLNALCRESAAAAQASPGAAVTLDLDPALPTSTTDAERLRIALVNLLVNARHAVNGDGRAGRQPQPAAAPVTRRAARQ